MEGLIKGDGRFTSWHNPGNPATRPPKSPSFQSAGCPPLDRIGSYVGSKNVPHNVSPRQHQRSPSANFAVDEQFSWLDDLLDDSESSSIKKGSHRRSASDSFTFLEAPDALYRISDIAEEGEFNSSGVGIWQTRDFSESDNSEISNVGQVMSLLVEDEQLYRKYDLYSSVSNPHCNSENTVSDLQTTVALENALTCEGLYTSKLLSKGLSQGKACNLETHDVSEEQEVGDPNDEPKQAKRQSAQRSRVRKLQYITELERIVNSLQTVVSTLSPQVAFLERKRLNLIMDNNYLTKRVALLSNQKNAKDAYYEALMREVQIWRKTYQYQLQEHRQPLPKKELQFRGQYHQQHHKSLSLPSNLNIPLEEFSMLNLNTSTSAESRPTFSTSAGFIDHLGVVPRSRMLGAGTPYTVTRTDTLVPGSKTLEGRLLSGGGLEFMVQNM